MAAYAYLRLKEENKLLRTASAKLFNTVYELNKDHPVFAELKNVTTSDADVMKWGYDQKIIQLENTIDGLNNKIEKLRETIGKNQCLE